MIKNRASVLLRGATPLGPCRSTKKAEVEKNVGQFYLLSFSLLYFYFVFLSLFLKIKENPFLSLIIISCFYLLLAWLLIILSFYSEFYVWESTDVLSVLTISFSAFLCFFLLFILPHLIILLLSHILTISSPSFTTFLCLFFQSFHFFFYFYSS